MAFVEPILVIIGGCHASGKKTAANLLQHDLLDRFPLLRIKIIDLMDYYKQDSTNPHSKLPNQFDFDQLITELGSKYIEMDVVIVFGLYALFNSKIREMASVSVFIDCDSDVRLGRWIKRDVLDLPKNQQPSQLEAVMNVYLNHARLEMKSFISNTKEYADIILPRGADVTGVAVISDGLQPLLVNKLQQNELILDPLKIASTSSFSEDKSFSSNSVNKEQVAHALRMQNTEYSVLSLSNDNFTNENKRFYDIN